MTWKALSHATATSGAPSIDYNSFAARYDAEDALPPEQQILHNLVDRFDEHGLVIKTANMAPQAGVQGAPEQAAKGEISQMARHAMKNS
jgi:hypothetical protein